MRSKCFLRILRHHLPVSLLIWAALMQKQYLGGKTARALVHKPGAQTKSITNKHQVELVLKSSPSPFFFFVFIYAYLFMHQVCAHGGQKMASDPLQLWAHLCEYCKLNAGPLLKCPKWEYETLNCIKSFSLSTMSFSVFCVKKSEVFMNCFWYILKDSGYLKVRMRLSYLVDLPATFFTNHLLH